MSSKKLLTIFGATGNQGGSIINTILSSPDLSSQYTLRAITRDPSKPNAIALSKRGVDLAVADLNDPASITKAIASSHGVFAVTNYWEYLSKTTEYTQGVNIVDACRSSGVKHLIWSALPHATSLTGNRLKKIDHFDSKAEVAQYAEANKGDMIVSHFMPGYFMSNLLSQIKPLSETTPQLAISLPWHPQHTWVPMMNIKTDTGLYVASLFTAGEKANGAYVQGVSEWLHPESIVSTLSKITGQNIIWNETEMSVEIADKLPKIPAEMMENMILIRDWSYYGVGAEERQGESDAFLLEGMEKGTWEAFVKEQKWEF